MDFEFDNWGNLTPYAILPSTLAHFEEFFVNSFENSTTRKSLFSNFCSFNADLSEVVGTYTQWIDGSFVTNKTNPHDIDIVTFLDFQTFERHEKIIKDSFTSAILRETKGIDVYFVNVFPSHHPNNYVTLFDTAYWQDFFGRTRLNRAKKRYPKGIVELKF